MAPRPLPPPQALLPTGLRRSSPAGMVLPLPAVHHRRPLCRQSLRRCSSCLTRAGGRQAVGHRRRRRRRRRRRQRRQQCRRKTFPWSCCRPSLLLRCWSRRSAARQRLRGHLLAVAPRPLPRVPSLPVGPGRPSAGGPPPGPPPVGPRLKAGLPGAARPPLGCHKLCWPARASVGATWPCGLVCPSSAPTPSGCGSKASCRRRAPGSFPHHSLVTPPWGARSCHPFPPMPFTLPFSASEPPSQWSPRQFQRWPEGWPRRPRRRVWHR